MKKLELKAQTILNVALASATPAISSDCVSRVWQCVEKTIDCVGRSEGRCVDALVVR